MVWIGDPSRLRSVPGGRMQSARDIVPV